VFSGSRSSDYRQTRDIVTRILQLSRRTTPFSLRAWSAQSIDIIWEDDMKNFLIGLGVGVGLGLLFAPMSGEETRVNLADRANDLASSARETYEQNRDRVQRGVENIRSSAERAMGQVRNTANDVAARATGTESSSPAGQNI
jgi:gas vesicle protein